ncbi:MAG: CDP-archaeol synthase [bacterium]|nr:CDP-archaeol synthase [bacterium]
MNTTLILASLYLILPAYIANMCPVIAGAANLPFGTPISSRLFGSHKTYRGFVFGILGALGMVYLQRHFQMNDAMESYRLLDYTLIPLPILALLFGGGALLGDLVKSFVKRRLGKKSGSAWFPFDQLDFVVGALLCVSFVSQISLSTWIVLLIVSPVLHVLVNIIGYHTGMKDVWW